MKKLKILIILIFFAFNFSFAQKKSNKNKELLVEKITSILYPSIGKVDKYDLSYSDELYEKYGIKFEFFKINVLDGSDCNFNFYNGEESLHASLNIGDYYPYPIYNADKTVEVKAKFNEYVRNEKKSIASKAEVIFYIYKQPKTKKK